MIEGFLTRVSDWATLPLDEGTRRVIAGGMRILHDPWGILGKAISPR